MTTPKEALLLDKITELEKELEDVKNTLAATLLLYGKEIREHKRTKQRLKDAQDHLRSFRTVEE